MGFYFFIDIKDSTVFLAALKTRLIATKDYDSTIVGNDSVKMAAAIKSFQKKMNLEPDGKGRNEASIWSFKRNEVLFDGNGNGALALGEYKIS